MADGPLVLNEVLKLAEPTTAIYEVVDKILDLAKDAESTWMCAP